MTQFEFPTDLLDDSGRPPRDAILIAHANITSMRATCSRAKVGVVIAREGRVLVTGYNGAPAGMPHCDHSCDCRGEYTKGLERKISLQPGWHDPDCPSVQPCKISVHAECNAIAWAARHGIRLEGGELVTTMCPCLPCAQLIINAGIIRVLAMQEYRSPDGLELLKNAGIALE